MKKLISILLCLVLLAAVPAFAAQGDVIFAMSDDGQGVLKNGVDTSCGVGDSLYMLLSDGDTLVVQKAGETEPKSYPIQIGEGEAPLNGYINYKLISGGDRLLALRLVYDYSGDTTSMEGSMFQIHVDGDSATAEELYTPDWSALTGEDAGNFYLNTCVSAGQWLLLQTYDDNGMSVFKRMSLADGTMQPCALGEVQSLSTYTDGRALVSEYTDEQYNHLRFSVYDPETDTSEALGEMDVEQYANLNGVATDMESGKTYFVRAGEILELDPATGTIGESVNDMPVDAYSDTQPSILTGGFYACANYRAYVLRNVNAAAERGTRLKIFDSSYSSSVNNAFYQFANEHGDVSGVLSRDYNDAQNLVDDMMNHSTDVDVYIMDVSSEGFEAVRSRGYMADFSGSDALNQLGDRMYDAVREQMSVNGQLAMLPVEITFWLPYMNETAMEKLGLTEADIPANWSDFLDFIAGLADKLPEDGSVRLFDPYTTDTGARSSLFNQIFRCYQQTLAADSNAVSTQEMTEILRKLEQIDFTALGLPTDEDTMRDDYNPDYDSDAILLQLDTGMSASRITNNQLPLVMSLTANTPAWLAADGEVAFINPYSEHYDLAIAFMETLAQNLDEASMAVYCADVTEPVENPTYEQDRQSAQDWLDQLKKQLENAEEIDRQEYEQELAYAQENMDNFEAQNRYVITAKDLEWLHANAEHFVLQGVNWLYSSSDDGSSGDAYDLVQQYIDGKITADKLMQEIDRKVRMRMMEGY